MREQDQFAQLLREVQDSSAEVAAAYALIERLKPQIVELIEAGRIDLLARELLHGEGPLGAFLLGFFYGESAQNALSRRDLGLYLTFGYYEGQMAADREAVIEDLSTRLRDLAQEPSAEPRTEAHRFEGLTDADALANRLLLPMAVVPGLDRTAPVRLLSRFNAVERFRKEQAGARATEPGDSPERGADEAARVARAIDLWFEAGETVDRLLFFHFLNH